MADIPSDKKDDKAWRPRTTPQWSTTVPWEFTEFLEAHPEQKELVRETFRAFARSMISNGHRLDLAYDELAKLHREQTTLQARILMVKEEIRILEETKAHESAQDGQTPAPPTPTAAPSEAAAAPDSGVIEQMRQEDRGAYRMKAATAQRYGKRFTTGQTLAWATLRIRRYRDEGLTITPAEFMKFLFPEGAETDAGTEGKDVDQA